MSKNTQFAQLNECSSYMLIFVQRIRAFFPAGTSNMRIKSHLAFQRDERQLFVPESRQIWSTVPHSSDLNPSVSSVTPPEFLHGLKQILSAEVRPKFLSYIDFGIAQLPEQKIRNPHFSRSSNE
jgi:hypothetical protein